MPGLFGPILSTGVALGAAVMVVTNPVTAPNADVAIPAAAVSAGTGQAVDMLDENFIKAVAADQPESTNPFIVLKDLVSTLVADAADLGKAAVLHAFHAGARVVSRPELTAASHPYVPTDIFPGPIPADLRPVVEQAWAQIVADAGDMGDPDVLAAALAAGATLGAEPGAFLDGLRQAVDANLRPAVDGAVSALAAAPRPGIGDAVRSAVERYLPAVPAVDHIAALPKRWNNPGSGPLDPDSGLTEPPSRPERPVAVQRVLSEVRSVVADRRLNSARTASPVGPRSGADRLGAADGETPHGLSANIGRAVKARAGRMSG